MQNIIYFFAILIFSSGLVMLLISDNYLQKIIGLGIFQTSVLVFYLALGKVSISNHITRDIFFDHSPSCILSNPLPQVLMLTAIVVNFSTMSVGLALISQIHKEYGTLSENSIKKKEENT